MIKSWWPSFQTHFSSTWQQFYEAICTTSVDSSVLSGTCLFPWRRLRAQSMTASLQMSSVNVTLCCYTQTPPAIFIQRALVLDLRLCRSQFEVSLLEKPWFLFLMNCMHTTSTTKRPTNANSFPPPCLPLSPYAGSRIIFIAHLRL